MAEPGAGPARELDVVLWGAAGYTGTLVARYLAERYAPGELRWALAGRNEQKLAALRERIGRADLPLVVADSHDEASLEAMALRARVVCTTVGPYAEHGEPLVAVCARTGTSYCDVSAELPWIARMIATHGPVAADSGARIVHLCGFDSVPSDLGCWMLQQHALAHLGAPCVDVRCRVTRFRTAVSGGTFASVVGLIEAAKADRDVMRLLQDPYALDPADDHGGADGPDPAGLLHDDELGWGAPFLTAGVNTRVVRRTHAVLGRPWGKGFRYSEAMSMGPGVGGLLRALGQVVANVWAAIALALPPLRALGARMLRIPPPGQGPDDAQLEAGCFEMVLLGRRAPGEPAVVRATVAAECDPAYGATRWMLAEAAVCLALDAADLPVGGGSWTPAAAMGDKLLQRLRCTPMRWDVGDV